MDNKAVRRTQQKFQNVINEPLLTGKPDDLILGLLAPPELHILIGTQKSYENLICLIILIRGCWQALKGTGKRSIS